jgi:uncharacterized protein YbaR (Trm112 family)
MSDDGFDIHAVRHRMKLVRNAGTTELYENRDGVACPACEEPFDDLLVTEERHHSFDPPDGTRLCVIREEKRVLVSPHG